MEIIMGNPMDMISGNTGFSFIKVSFIYPSLLIMRIMMFVADLQAKEKPHNHRQ